MFMFLPMPAFQREAFPRRHALFGNRNRFKSTPKKTIQIK
jgi:hypothetical protein